jgi:hypothetical protein
MKLANGIAIRAAKKVDDNEIIRVRSVISITSGSKDTMRSMAWKNALIISLTASPKNKYIGG